MASEENRTGKDATPEKESGTNFIHAIIDKDLEQKKYSRKVMTRFPPEPNGYLHIGHAKSICLNFGTAIKYGGECNLRFDDTNPITEDEEFVDSIAADVEWLGFKWDRLLYASDYFETMYEGAIKLIKAGKAYICELSSDEIRATKGTLTEPGENSPYRDRPIEESLEMFKGMREGEYEDGQIVLRAKIDMSSPNINMRDPVLYRVLHATHHNTGDEWCLYPMYDYAHPIEDAIEGITHSICTLEFEDHRPFYDWVLEGLEWPEPPQQIEFAKLNLSNTIMSKRNIKKLVGDGDVEGWDDPRLCTIAGIRRRGYTPEAIRAFCDAVGVAKANSQVEMSMLEFFVRDDLKDRVESRMVILDPIKVVITNYPEDKTEMLPIENSMSDPEKGNREVSFSRTLYVEREDFMEIPAKKYFRLFPGNEVRLKGAYFITCTDVIKDASGKVVELHCTYDPATKSGSGFEERKPKGTIHWVDANTAVDVLVRHYGYLAYMNEETKKYEFDPESKQDMLAKAEPSVAHAKAGDRFQFFRNGYYIADTVLSKEGAPVFNEIVGLKSSWKKK